MVRLALEDQLHLKSAASFIHCCGFVLPIGATVNIDGTLAGLLWAVDRPLNMCRTTVNI